MKYSVLIALAVLLSVSQSYAIINTVQLGSSANLYTILTPEVNRIAANNDLNTIIFIHRSNPADFPNLPNESIGHYRYDISTDGGATWTTNYGVLNPSSNEQTIGGRYPNTVIHNPLGNTNPANAYLGYLGSWLPFNTGGNWDGYFAGVARLDNDSSTFTENIYTPNNGDIEIARGMCNGAPGIFWAVDWEWDDVEYTAVLVFKGIWNPATHDIDWIQQVKLTPPFDRSVDGTAQGTSLNIAFDPSGQYGWIGFLGDIAAGGDQYFQPVFYSTNDGGTTWNGPIIIDLTTFENVMADLPAGPPPTTAFDQDMVVDINGNPHMAVVVGSGGAGNAYSIQTGSGTVNKIYDFTYNANATNSCGWKAILIDSVLTFRGDNIAGDVNEDNRPQASLSPDGKKVFFGWLDSNPIITGGGNVLPDFYTRGWDVTTGLATPVLNRTAGTNWEGGALFASTAPSCLEDNGTYTIPTVFTELNASGLETDPTTFHYVQGVQYMETDFTMDVLPPVIRLNGSSPITVLVGNNINDPGATAVDNVGGNMTANITVDSLNVNTNVPGPYIITYDVTDAAGNKACQVVREVNVVNAPDVTPPIITLIGTGTINIGVCGFFSEPGATATDNLDGNITNNIMVTSNVPSPLVAGTYTINYDVNDGAGNPATTVTRTVVISDLPPTIILLGDNPDYTENCNGYLDPGALAFDNCLGSIPVSVTGTVNINNPGSYTLTYTATDSVNLPISVNRTVIVTPDATAPTIDINGSDPMYVYLGTAFIDPLASASDCSGSINLTSSVVSDAGLTVNTAVRGIYTVTYTVSDAAGNTATATRNVIVNTEPDPGFGYFVPSGNTVYFLDSSLYDPTSWLWDFGDNNGSAQPSPLHTYSTGGVYTVCLQVSNIFNDPPFNKPVLQHCKNIMVGTVAPPWNVTTTSENHTILINPVSFSSNINGSMIANGDYIGAFYDNNGNLTPAGYEQWNGNVLAFPVYGNDANPPAKNGFDLGEKFKWKVWQTSTQSEVDVTATYMSVGSMGGLITDTDEYTYDGFSGLTSVTSCGTQNITINAGWNMISSYIIPDNPNMLQVINAISSDILLIKNGSGQTTIPSLGINTIGNWDVTEGYKIKATNSTTLTMGCQLADPLATPISLNSGWSIIAYLRTTPMDVSTAFSSVNNNVLLVKNADGDVFLPSLSINNIGNMIPGQGYKIKMSSPAIFYYPANNKVSTMSIYIKPKRPIHFASDINTGHNSTIIVPFKSVTGLATGDEIGVFGRNGKLAGAATYEGTNLAITVWGDDPTTDELEGMASGDEYTFRLWRANQQIETLAEVAYESGDETYRTDGISYLQKLEIKEPFKQQTILNVYPNPTDGKLNIAYYLPVNDDVQLHVYDVYGKELMKEEITDHSRGEHIMTLDLSEFPAGVYICDFKSKGINSVVKVQKYY